MSVDVKQMGKIMGYEEELQPMGAPRPRKEGLFLLRVSSQTVDRSSMEVTKLSLSGTSSSRARLLGSSA
jgi:hypothetical protein